VRYECGIEIAMLSAKKYLLRKIYQKSYGSSVSDNTLLIINFQPCAANTRSRGVKAFT